MATRWPGDTTNAGMDVDQEEGYIAVSVGNDGNVVDEELNEPPSSPSKEREIIRRHITDNNKLKKGEYWYPISQKWWDEWKGYAGYEGEESKANDMTDENEAPQDGQSQRPGVIDNSDLEDSTNPDALRHGIQEKLHYHWIHESVWTRLHKWYGGGRAFRRKVRVKPAANTWSEPEAVIDTYPLYLKFFEVDQAGEPHGDGVSKPYFRGTKLWNLRRELIRDDEKHPDADGDEKMDREGAEGSLDPGDEDEGAQDYRKMRIWLRQSLLYPDAHSREGEAGDEEMGDAGAAGSAPREDPWVEVPEDTFDAPHQSLQQLLRGDTKTSTVDVVLERNRSTPYKKEAWVRKKVNYTDWHVGDIIDVHDPKSKAVIKWYEAVVTKVGGYLHEEPLEVNVHYISWDKKWDEWIKSDAEDRMNFRGKHTVKCYRTAVKPGASTTKSTAMVAVGKSTTTTYNNSRWSGNSYWNSNEEGEGLAAGIVGLRNLGNTCFMNSTIQCLAQSPGLTDFFLQDKYKQEINRDNPLGWKGRIAEEWAGLVQNMFCNKYRVVSPRTLKQAIGEFQPRFMGYQQQDSQELLAFLIDGIHEDLNRVVKKPYTQDVESKGRPDEVVAQEAWETYRKRNDSIIVDKMTGMFKSRLICPNPDCQTTHIKFDPFTVLSVPLPTSKTKTVPYTFVGYDGTIKAYGAECKKIADVRAMRKDVCKQVDLPADQHTRLLSADVWKSKIHRRLKLSDMVNDIRSNDDIYVYHIDLDRINAFFGVQKRVDETEQDKKGPPPLQIINQKLEKNPHYRPNYSYSKEFNTEPFGIPLYTCLPHSGSTSKPITNRLVFQHISDLLKPWIQQPAGAPALDQATALPYKIYFKDENSYSYGNEEELVEDDEPFDMDRKVKFMVNWLQPEYYDCDRADDPERDSSAPTKKAGYSRGGGDTQSAVSLTACIQEFTIEEELSEGNEFYCPKCQKHGLARKKMDIWKLPDLLVIHLKRFQYNRYWRDKISTRVNFPVTEPLDLSQWVVNVAEQPRSKFKLYAVSNHMGGMGGGHYTAYARGKIDSEWYELNDSSTSKVRGDPETEIIGSASYVLYYERDPEVMK